MSEIIKNITKALYREIPGSEENWPIWRTEEIALAVIASMREPTPRMLRMLQLHIDHGSYAINAWKDTVDVASETSPADFTNPPEGKP